MVRQSIIPPPERKFDSFANQTGAMVKIKSRLLEKGGPDVRCWPVTSVIVARR
jgi:hypothetical protein